MCLYRDGDGPHIPALQNGHGDPVPPLPDDLSVSLRSGIRLDACADSDVFPFSIHVCINGREWLSRRMDREGLRYFRQQNCFPWVEDIPRAQQLFQKQLQVKWADLLQPFAQGLNPLHEENKANFEGPPRSFRQFLTNKANFHGIRCCLSEPRLRPVLR